MMQAFLEIPEGLEHPCSRWLLNDGYANVATARPGLLSVGIFALIKNLPRYTYGIRYELAKNDATKLTNLFESCIDPTHYLNTEDKPISYRFWVEGRKVSPLEQKQLLSQCRNAFAQFDMHDAPSAYTHEIILSYMTSRPTLYLRQTQLSHNRFSYRVEDVPAAINPVFAAALVRLLPSNLGGITIDPTCGSGTLLIERKLYCSQATLVGIDISEGAIAAAKTNVTQAELQNDVALVNSDSCDPAVWQPCSIVLANLPFGNRVGRNDDLPALYKTIMVNALANLTANGRLLLASAHKTGLDKALQASPGFKTTREISCAKRRPLCTDICARAKIALQQ